MLRAGIARRMFGILLIVAAADYLFVYYAAGISLPLFLLIGAGILVVLQGLLQRQQLLALAVMAISLLPAIEDVNLLSTCFALAGLCLFAALALSPASHALPQHMASAARLAFFAPLLMLRDMFSPRRQRLAAFLHNTNARWLIGWILPVGAAVIFLLVFSAANPIVEAFLVQLDFSMLSTLLDMTRIAFWIFIFALAWPFVFFRPARMSLQNLPVQQERKVGEGLFLGYDAVLRSLVILNLVFGWQTWADVLYLWGGAALPPGVTYAQYAQRGAYALIVAALLSAFLLLAMMRRGTRAEASRTVRVFVYLWIVQNVLMMASASMRLYAYVDTYSLTYQRIAAFVLIFLIGCGFLLIVLRILGQRSNLWLVAANAVVLVWTIYALSFVNFPRTIAEFNIAHSREVTGEGVTLDVGYLVSLGPHAMSSLDIFLRTRPDKWNAQRNIHNPRERIAQYLRRREDWRSWTWRDARLRAAYAAAP